MTQILLPELGEGITSVEISDVNVKVGDNLSIDDILIVVETDKASMEIPSGIEGVVKSINIKTGQEIKTGDLLITLETTKTTNKDIKQTPKQKEQTQHSRKIGCIAICFRSCATMQRRSTSLCGHKNCTPPQL